MKTPGPDSAPPKPTQDLLARAFNAAPNGFVLVDSPGRIVAANAELHRMFGHKLDTLVGKSVEMLHGELSVRIDIDDLAGFIVSSLQDAFLDGARQQAPTNAAATGVSAEGLADGVRRITTSKGVDIVIESIGGTVTNEALSSLSLGGVLITLGYSAGRKTTIDLTDLIWKRARMAGFSLFAQSPAAIASAWREVLPPIVNGSVKPIVERVYPFGEAAEALRRLIEDRPFGKVVLAG